MQSKREVLDDLEEIVQQLIDTHDKRREVWWPSDFFTGDADDRETLRRNAKGMPYPARIGLVLSLITEEGLPHFHRVLATHLGEDSFWHKWNNLWTAEEDRHGVVLHDYCRESLILEPRALDQLVFQYVRSGFNPKWEGDPYRVFVYTTLQERATQYSHANTGKLAGSHEPRLELILSRIASEEARHFAFYRQVFAEILKRDPNQALYSASRIIPNLRMPGVDMPDFGRFADVARRAGIYGPRQYLEIVQDQIRFWKIESMTGLNEMGEKAQAKIMAIPDRLKRLAELAEKRTRPQTFAFDITFNTEFTVSEPDHG